MSLDSDSGPLGASLELELEPDLEETEQFNRDFVKTYKHRVVALEVEKTLREQEFVESFTPPQIYANAAEGLAVDRPPLQYGLDQLVVRGGNVLITAGYKTGKTDLCFNIVKAYADEEALFGRFAPMPLDEGRQVVMLDFELDEDYSWNIFRLLGVQNTSAANLICFRGKSFSLTAETHRDWLVEKLSETGCQVLIVDPFGAAFTGEENSNSEVREWLRSLDQVKELAGIREVYLTTHTGRGVVEEGQERARGATRLNDWADSIWTYTRDETPDTDTPRHHRFLRATGRGVDLDEMSVEWASETHVLTAIDGGGNRKISRENSLKNKILLFVKDNPGATGNAIAKGVGGRKLKVLDALKEMSDPDDAGHFLDVSSGPNNSSYYSLSVVAEITLKKNKKSGTTVA